MKTVIFYEYNPEKTMEDLMAVFPRHDEIQKQFAAQGKILGIGPLRIISAARWEFLPTANLPKNL